METRVPNPERLRAIIVSGGHAFDSRTGRSYNVNETGQVALGMMQEGAAPAAVVDALVGLCGQPAAVVEAGFVAFLDQLARYAP